VKLRSGSGASCKGKGAAAGQNVRADIWDHGSVGSACIVSVILQTCNAWFVAFQVRKKKPLWVARDRLAGLLEATPTFTSRT